MAHLPYTLSYEFATLTNCVPDNFLEPSLFISRVRMFFKLNQLETAVFLYFSNMAEKEGFEPSIGINLYTLSRRAPSAARTLLQNFYNSKGALSYTLIASGMPSAARTLCMDAQVSRKHTDVRKRPLLQKPQKRPIWLILRTRKVKPEMHL